MGAMGAVCEAVCTKHGVLHGERFALKAMFNLGVSDAHCDDFNQCVLARTAPVPHTINFVGGRMSGD